MHATAFLKDAAYRERYPQDLLFRAPTWPARALLARLRQRFSKDPAPDWEV